MYEYEFPWLPNRRYSINFTAKTFLENYKYCYCILHKKVVLDETFTIIHISTHISLNIAPSILNLHVPEHPFPLAGLVLYRRLN